MFARDVIQEIAAAAEALGVEAAALLAVAEVESGGAAFALGGGRRDDDKIGFAREVSDHVVFFRDGIIAEEGPQSILRQPKSQPLTAFLGSVRS